MRIVAWNIRGGGGERAGRIARQLDRWAPDVVVLSEFRGTPPSCALAARLAARLPHQLSSVSGSSPGENALLVAARWPVSPVRLRRGPAEPCRWLAARVATPSPLVVGAMHIPNRVSGRKYPYFDAVLACTEAWEHGPALLVGDTNSGRRGLDEEVPAFNVQEESWIDRLAACGWTDAFRHLYPEARAYTWYSPNGRNGFRIDQAFLNPPLLARLKSAVYLWGGASLRRRRTLLSDHAALVVDLAEP